MSSQSNNNKPDYLRMLMETQHNQLLQAQQDRAASAKRMTQLKEASAQRIAQLEEAILLMSTRKQDCPDHRATTPSSDRIDLQRFRTADGPLFSGPFHDVERFLNWFKSELFNFALPLLWLTTLQDQLRDLRLRDNKTFSAFSTRARTIQTLVNFDGDCTDLGDDRPITISDLELAETVVYGLPPELKVLVKNHKVILKRPFRYTDFKSCTQLFYDGLPRKGTSSQRPTGNLTQSASAPVSQVPRDKTIWRVHSFLDSQGRCHHCKKQCGSAPGSCPNSLNRAYVEIPASFVTSPKPSDYKPPKAWAPASSGAGKPTQAPAGRAPSKASVSEITEDTICPDLDAASVAAFAAITKELCLAREEGYVSPHSSDRIVLLLQCGDISLRALVNTGSEINLIAESAARRANLNLLPLAQPTTVHLALDNKSATPLLLKYFVSTNFFHSSSSLSFANVSLRVGPIKGSYNVILGTPFLARFNLSVSVSSQCLRSEDSACVIFEFRHPSAMNTQHFSISSVASAGLHEEVAKRILKEFEDLFPVNIPAVSDDMALGGLPNQACKPPHAARRPHAYKWREDGRLGVRPRQTGVLAMHACLEGVQALHALRTGVHGWHACPARLT
ncbi:hypothetical protein PCASD_17694 [Puccinia coronata f. sp. avenae]|uniref:Uncharacterized protein n=1 Tax=Puccinia coronata f. sp. avenae TaxID=200324 RepID=A0A2N5TS05_9BASI|nr:hypothetical protein PCASD_17694 [Puccinia coronata f. sp. avenae]